METWKSIPGYRYLISDKGEVKSPAHIVDIGLGRSQYKPERILKVYIANTGYRAVGVTTSRCRSKAENVHRLLALAFLPNPHNYKCINHKDGDKLNNNIDNLEWVSHGINNKHAYDTGLKKPCYKVSPHEAIQIKALYNIFNISQADLGRMYSVNSSTICGIVNNKTRLNG